MNVFSKQKKAMLFDGRLAAKQSQPKNYFDPTVRELIDKNCELSDKWTGFWNAPITPTGAAALVETLNLKEEECDETVWGLYKIYTGYQNSYNAKANYQLGNDFDEIPGLRDHIDFPSWRHQRAAYQFLKHMAGVLIDGGMGVGKTLMTLASINAMGIKRVVVATPKRAIKDAWVKGAEPFRKSIVVIPLTEAGVFDKFKTLEDKMRLLDAKGDERSRIIVVNYESIWRHPLSKYLMARNWDLIVCDEIQKIKSATSRSSKFMGKFALKAPRRWGLSGTPCPHSIFDAFGVFRFLDAAVFGTNVQRFRHNYGVYGGYEGRQVLTYKNEEDYTERFNSITLKIDRNVLDLPEVQHLDRNFSLPPKIRTLYDQFRAELVAEIKEGLVTADNALVKFLRLAQVTSGFVKVQETVDGEVLENPYIETLHKEKTEVAIECLNEIPKEESVVIFCRFREDISRVKKAIREEGAREVFEISGRKDELEEWNESPNGSVIVVQIQSGGTGISLVKACYCIYYSTDLSLGNFNQSKARVHRPGQNKPVTYIYIKATNTIDTKTYEAFNQKQAVLDYMLREI